MIKSLQIANVRPRVEWNNQMGLVAAISHTDRLIPSSLKQQNVGWLQPFPIQIFPSSVVGPHYDSKCTSITFKKHKRTHTGD